MIAAATLWSGVMLAGFPVTADVAKAHDCRRVALLDADTGARVRGAEDMAVDRSTGSVFIVAVDRWALEEAVEQDRSLLPQGAIYVLPAQELVAAEGELRVHSAARAFASANPFHPQGIGIRHDSKSVTVAVVNRRYRRTQIDRSHSWQADPVVEVFSFSGTRLEHRRSVSHAFVCHPNDVAVVSSVTFVVTNDHDCANWPTWMDNALGLENAGLVLLEIADPDQVNGQLLANDIGFANGVVVTGGNRLYVAATREQAIRVYQLTNSDRGKWRTRLLERLAVKGAPDNIESVKDSGMLVAVHPSLISLALYRYRWWGRNNVASRVINLSLDGVETVVFDDPEGKMISAATVAVSVAGHLIAGSVTDSGLMICRLKS